MSFAVFFGVLSATSLVAALAALWGSLRAAFGGDGGVGIQSPEGAPERATLLDEKTSLLRAIKDLSYEHQVGKLDRADFERLDRAYRARAKEVLELLDRDVRPYRARAEELLARVSPASDGDASPRGDRGLRADAAQASKGSKKRRGAQVPSPRDERVVSAVAEDSASSSSASDATGSAEPAARPTDASVTSTDALVDKLESLTPEQRAQAAAFLARLAAEATSVPASPPEGADDTDDEGMAEDDAADPAPEDRRKELGS